MPEWGGEIRRRLAGLNLTPVREAEIVEEWGNHLDDRYREHRLLGASEAEASAAALAELPDIDAAPALLQESERPAPPDLAGPRSAGGVRRAVESWIRAFRQAGRRLRSAPAFAGPAIATLAVGIGATTALFTLVDAVLLRPLPLPDSERLVAVQHQVRGLGPSPVGLSDGLMFHYRRHNTVFGALGLYVENDGVTVSDQGDPERVRVALVTPGVMDMVGVRPVLGRLFTAEESRPGGPTGVVLIAHDLWARRYGSDPGLVGRRVELNRKWFRVIGIMPRGFAFPRPETMVWYTMGDEASDPAQATIGAFYYQGIARLRPGVSAQAAQADLRRLIPSVVGEFVDATPARLQEMQIEPLVQPLKTVLVGDVRRPLVLLLAAAGFMLLVAWANVGNLVLVRAERQQREVAVEQALGASRADVARRIVSETAVLAGIGGGLGFLLAVLVVAARFGLTPAQIPRWQEIRLDASSAAVALALALVSGTFLTVVALLRTGGSRLTDALRNASRRSSGTREWRAMQRALVVLQVAAALTLLIGSAIMVKTYARITAVDLGFDSRKLLTLDYSLPALPYPTYLAGTRFNLQLMERLRVLPGVTAVEAATNLPLSDPWYPAPFESDAPSTDRPSAPVWGGVNSVTPTYFSGLGIPMARGRTFVPGDLGAPTFPVVLSGALARQLFGHVDPLGHRVRMVGRGFPARWYPVIGVAGDVPGSSIPAGPVATLYFPILGEVPGDTTESWVYGSSDVRVAIRSSVEPSSLIASVREAIRGIDSKVPIAHVRSMDDIVAAATAPTRVTMRLLLAAAGAALLLGIIGVYGVISYAVSQRTHEFGIRLALGANPFDLRRLVLRQGLLLVTAGIGAGLLAALGLTRFLRGLVFGVSPTDPAAFVLMSAFLLAIAAVAAYLPAQRAAKTDPVIVLKGD